MMTDDAQYPQGQLGEQPYSSFLIRSWGLSGGTWRIKVQHIQSGQWTGVATFAEVTTWLEGRARDPLPAQEEEVEQTAG